LSLAAEGKLANIKRSFEAYVMTNLSGTFAIDWNPRTFNDKEQREWIQPTLLGPGRPDTRLGRGVGDGIRGHGVIFIVNINMFVRPSLQTNSYRLWTVRDLVLAFFHEHCKIPVMDHEGDVTTMGNLIVRRVTVDQEMPIQGSQAEDLQQYTLQAEADWVETYSAIAA
jgi:hypothetical protein